MDPVVFTIAYYMGETVYIYAQFSVLEYFMLLALLLVMVVHFGV